MARDAAPHLASAASDPAANVAELRFRERAKYSSLGGIIVVAIDGSR